MQEGGIAELLRIRSPEFPGIPGIKSMDDFTAGRQKRLY